VDVDYAKLRTDKQTHAQEIVAALTTKQGLEYMRHSHSRDGRLIDHAYDARSLAK
jgi:hypothetical protein